MFVLGQELFCSLCSLMRLPDPTALELKRHFKQLPMSFPLSPCW